MPEALALLRETSDPPDGKEGASTPQHSWSYDTCRTRRDAQLAEGGTSRQAGVSRQAVLALLKYPFYPLFILDNGMNLISKS